METIRIPPNKHVFYGPGDFVLGWGSTGRKVNIEQFFFPKLPFKPLDIYMYA